MTPKKIKLIVAGISLAVTFVFFIIKLLTIISYFSNPFIFSFVQIGITISLMFVILAHFAFMVSIMEDKPRRKKYVEDIEEWWTKWDRA